MYGRTVHNLRLWKVGYNICTVIQKKRNTLIYFNANYRTEIKLVLIIMNYCLLQFDAL